MLLHTYYAKGYIGIIDTVLTRVKVNDTLVGRYLLCRLYAFLPSMVNNMLLKYVNSNNNMLMSSEIILLAYC